MEKRESVCESERVSEGEGERSGQQKLEYCTPGEASGNSVFGALPGSDFTFHLIP